MEKGSKGRGRPVNREKNKLENYAKNVEIIAHRSGHISWL